ncbi:MAG TPA: hypothetical protein VGD35_11250, partial [Chitinophaga sp.]
MKVLSPIIALTMNGISAFLAPATVLRRYGRANLIDILNRTMMKVLLLAVVYIYLLLPVSAQSNGG